MASMNANADLYNQILSYRKKTSPNQCLSQLWFVRVPKEVYYPRYRCLIEPLICGEEVFGKIAEDLLSARHSVDIITWGFDPGMVLVRGSSAEDGVRYGDLLKRIATRKQNPVKVRLLVWHDDAASHAQMNNCSFAGRIDPLSLTLPPGPRERRDPVVRPLEPQFF